MRRRLPYLASVVLTFGLSACGDSTGVDVALGAYVLVTVDGEPLPWVAQDDPPLTLRLITTFLHIFPDDCRFDATWQATFDGVIAAADVRRYDCTWSRDGSDLTITGPETPIDSTVGTLDGDGLSLMNPNIGIVFYYERLRGVQP